MIEVTFATEISDHPLDKIFRGIPARPANFPLASDALPVQTRHSPQCKLGSIDIIPYFIPFQNEGARLSPHLTVI
jgi:hypothetical protein